MHISSSLWLAIVGAISSLACGFSLRPHAARCQKSPHPTDRLLTEYDRICEISMACNNAGRFKGFGMRGGASSSNLSSTRATCRASSSDGTSTCTLASLWGAGGVIMILVKSIKRIIPIAFEPFSGDAIPLSTFQLGAYISMCLWFAYVEGYKGFQLKFSPLVVARSETLTKNSPIHHTLLAPFYAMGLFYATKKRKIVSWSVSIGVAVVVAAVKRLPYPWRNIVDAGVIVGLTWGSISIGLEWIKTVVLGIETKMDPALPEKKD